MIFMAAGVGVDDGGPDRDGDLAVDPGQTVAVPDPGQCGLLDDRVRFGNDVFELIALLHVDCEVYLSGAVHADLSGAGVAGICHNDIFIDPAVRPLVPGHADGDAGIADEPDLVGQHAAAGAEAQVTELVAGGRRLVLLVALAAFGAGIDGIAGLGTGGRDDLGHVGMLALPALIRCGVDLHVHIAGDACDPEAVFNAQAVREPHSLERGNRAQNDILKMISRRNDDQEIDLPGAADVRLSGDAVAGDGLGCVILAGAAAILLGVGGDAHARRAVEPDRKDVECDFLLHLDRDSQVAGDLGHAVAVDHAGLKGALEVLECVRRLGGDAVKCIAGFELHGEVHLTIAGKVDPAAVGVAGTGGLRVVLAGAADVLCLENADGHALITDKFDCQFLLSAFGADAVDKPVRKRLHLIGDRGCTALGAGVGGIALGSAGGRRDHGDIAVIAGRGAAGGKYGNRRNQGNQNTKAQQHAEQTVFHTVPFLISVILDSCKNGSDFGTPKASTSFSIL